ncbi:MAG: VWA domain-containing protein, partial [Chloroflexia bacterium]
MFSFRYSRWDGTQQILPFDAEAIMDAISEDILAHGDVRRALEKLMQQGHRFQTGERMPGLRDLLDRLKQARQDTLRQHNMDAIVNDIRQRLEKIKETERAGIDRRVDEGRKTNDESTASEQDPSSSDVRPSSEQQAALQKMLESMAARRKEQLDNLPPDLAGQIKGLKEYDFMDPDARQQFQDLMKMLEQQMVQNTFSGLQESMQRMQTDPQAMEATREMLRDLNQMLRAHSEGRDPHFNEFMQKHGHHFPPGIENIDQLLEHLRAQMQRMENMLESMSPQQRAQLQGMMQGMMQDSGFQAEMQELAEQLGALMPMRSGRQYRFSGDPDESLSMSEAMQIMEQLDELEKLERDLNAARRGESMDDIDRDKVAELLGPDAQQALDQLRELARELEEAGYLEWKGAEMQLTPRATRKLGQKALQDIFAYLKRDAFGKHAVSIRGRGGERTYDSKPYEFGDVFHLDLRATLGNALARAGVGTPVKLEPPDFEVHSTEYMTQSSTVLLIDMSRSMLLRGCFLAAKKVALALNHLIRSQFPKD